MRVTINGEQQELPDDATVASAVELISVAPGARGVAVAVRGEVVPRGSWALARLADGDQIEIVAAIQGG